MGLSFCIQNIQQAKPACRCTVYVQLHQCLASGGMTPALPLQRSAGAQWHWITGAGGCSRQGTPSRCTSLELQHPGPRALQALVPSTSAFPCNCRAISVGGRLRAGLLSEEAGFALDTTGIASYRAKRIFRHQYVKDNSWNFYV